MYVLDPKKHAKVAECGRHFHAQEVVRGIAHVVLHVG